MVGLGRLELPTSRLSIARSNQLSYKPETPARPNHQQVANETTIGQGLSRERLARIPHEAKLDLETSSQTAARARPGRKRNEGGEVPHNGLLIKA